MHRILGGVVSLQPIENIIAYFMASIVANEKSTFSRYSFEGDLRFLFLFVFVKFSLTLVVLGGGSIFI